MLFHCSSGKIDYYINCVLLNVNQFTFITDLLFIEEDIILELPSFKRSECQVPGFPGGSSATGVAGLVSDTLAACALGRCWSLTAGVWTSIASMGVARGNYSAASNSSEGWMVTGGLDITSEIPPDYYYEYNYKDVKNRYHLKGVTNIYK